MAKPLAAAFSFVVAAAGWYYTLYAREQGGVTGEAAGRINRSRQRLRRFGGVVMMALAICLFAGFWSVDWETPTWAFVGIWVSVMALLGAIVVLGILDLRLTWKLHKVRRKEAWVD